MAVSITDHDNFMGYQDARCAARSGKVLVIPGLELSCTCHDQEIHVLGYFIDVDNQALLQHTKNICASREVRTRKILSLLSESGIQIPFDTVKKAAGNGCIGRPHIANLLIELGHVRTFQEAFDRYLGDHKSAFVEKDRLSLADAIALIKNANGLAFLAHPGLYACDHSIPDLLNQGFDGLEVIHPRHDECDRYFYSELADDLGLLKCGGSDYHGIKGIEPSFGYPYVPFSYFEEMQRYNGWVQKNKWS